MKIYDISQEVFSCAVYPGDPEPEKQELCSTAAGDLYNLTYFSMCAHNGTHVDAPFHFIHHGKTVDALGLEPFVGECYVARCQGDIGEKTAEEILWKAKGARRILLAGDLTVTAEAASVFAEAGIRLFGNEGQSVGPDDAPMQVHLILLRKEIVLLEGIVLKDVPEGNYF